MVSWGQAELKTELYGASFGFKIEKFNEMPVGTEVISSKFTFNKDLAFCLNVNRTTNTLYNIYLQPLDGLFFKVSADCRLSFINKNGILLLSTPNINIFEWKRCMPIATFSTTENQELQNYLKTGNSLTIRCTLFFKPVEIESMYTSEISLNVESTPEMTEVLSVEATSSTEPVSATSGVIRLIEDLKSFLFDEEDCDIILKVKDVEIPTYRIILKARSSVFRAMLSHDMIEKNKGIVNIDDCDPNCFKEYLHYLYSGETDRINQENVIGLYIITDKYNSEELKSECIKFITKDLCLENFFDYITIALRHPGSALLNLAKEIFVKNMKIIMETTSWLPFVQENLVESQELLLEALRKVNLTPVESNK